MRVVHLCLTGPYTDGVSYQENILPQYHQQRGHDVIVVASPTFLAAGGAVHATKVASRYVNEVGIPVIRLRHRWPSWLSRRFRRYVGLSSVLRELSPDVLFVHGCQFLDIRHVAQYAREHAGTRVYVDNHAEFSNSARNMISRYILHGIVWRLCAKSVEPITRKFYGVLPARVDFLVRVYHVAEAKVELLLMGAEDEKVAHYRDEDVKAVLRNKYGMSPSDFVIVTGGKIDSSKRQTLLLMQAIRNSSDSRLRLVVFGSIDQDMLEHAKTLVDGVRIQHVGWLSSDESYGLFAIADLAVFPGRHSVYWEQAAGQGVPLVVKYWEGTTHVDLGGNCAFLRDDTEMEISQVIHSIRDTPGRYAAMKRVADSRGLDVFSYRRIAARSIEDE